MFASSYRRSPSSGVIRSPAYSMLRWPRRMRRAANTPLPWIPDLRMRYSGRLRGIRPWCEAKKRPAPSRCGPRASSLGAVRSSSGAASQPADEFARCGELHRELLEGRLHAGVEAARHAEHERGEGLLHRVFSSLPLRFERLLRNLGDGERLAELVLEQLHDVAL